jgi:hypothetical protein
MRHCQGGSFVSTSPVRSPNTPRGKHGWVVRRRTTGLFMQRNGTYWKLDTAEVFPTAHAAYQEAAENEEIYSLACAREQLQREYAARLQARVGEREGRG